MKKISIIIPLYNLEGLIGKCIASALDQDLPPEEYEVIVVDDGSTDGSLAAAQRAACGHANVQVHAKPNEGVSLARNYGTERAAGRYVMYVDADDYLSPGVLGGLTQIMDRERLDMLCFDMAGVDEHGGDLPLWSDGLFARGGGEVQSGRDFLRRDCFLPMACAYLYDRAMLERHELGMLPMRHEDEEFTPRAIYFAKRIRYVPIRVYNYLQHNGSFMGSYDPQRRSDFVRAMKSLTGFAARIEESDPEGARLMRLHVGKTMFFACKQTILGRQGNAREMLRDARQQGVMPLAFRRYNFRHFLINRAPALFVLYYRLHKRR